MEFFNNAKSVRLLGDTGKYLVAQDEKEMVKLRKNGLLQQACWIVERDVHHQDRIRLRSCFGKYLTASMEPYLLGATGRKVTQTLLSTDGHHKQYWCPSAVTSRVKLKACGGDYLRANGGLPPWRNNVTHTTDPMISNEILWVVEILEFHPQRPVDNLPNCANIGEGIAITIDIRDTESSCSIM